MSGDPQPPRFRDERPPRFRDAGVRDALRIAMAARLPFTGLRDRPIDYRLFCYVPIEVATREAVLPLSIDDDTLTVAAATESPDLHEVEATFPALPVRIVIAPRHEIREILERVMSEAA